MTWLFHYFLLGVFALWDPVSVTGPVYPPDAVDGRNRRSCASGYRGLCYASGNPCRRRAPSRPPRATRSASWRFKSGTGSRAHSGGAPISEILTCSPSVRNARQKFQRPECHTVRATCRCPGEIVEPVYPANVIGQGSVVLRLEIDDSGNVSDVTELNPGGGLTTLARKLCAAWKFAPAPDQCADGKPGPGLRRLRLPRSSPVVRRRFQDDRFDSDVSRFAH